MLKRLATDQLVGTSTSRFVPTATRSYATAKASTSGGKKKEAGGGGSRGSRGQEGAGDPRLELIKKNLFDSTSSDLSRLESLSSVIPSLSVHETITRSFALFQRHQREAQSASLARKYAAMRSALDELERADPRLWELATGGKRFGNVDQKERGNERLEGIWPREAKVPMEERGEGGSTWDKDWKREEAKSTSKAGPEKM